MLQKLPLQPNQMESVFPESVNNKQTNLTYLLT